MEKKRLGAAFSLLRYNVGMMQTTLQSCLLSTRVCQYKYFESIGSTNDEALAWIQNRAEDFSLVIADEQTKGRGRFDRRWVTRPGSSLAFTLILKPQFREKEMIPFFSPLCGIAVREAVEKSLGAAVEIKWPNDVLINRKKFCGILVEASWMDSELAGIILGIGINISRGSVPPMEFQQFPATSLENETSLSINRFEILQNVLLSLDQWRAKLGTSEFMKTWENHLAFVGEQVRIEHSGKPSIIGKMKGINLQGNLVLMLEDGQEMSFEIGDVHLRPGTSTGSGGLYAG